jgi:hypothetical protein
MINNLWIKINSPLSIYLKKIKIKLILDKIFIKNKLTNIIKIKIKIGSRSKIKIKRDNMNNKIHKNKLLFIKISPIKITLKHLTRVTLNLLIQLKSIKIDK